MAAGLFSKFLAVLILSSIPSSFSSKTIMISYEYDNLKGFRPCNNIPSTYIHTYTHTNTHTTNTHTHIHSLTHTHIYIHIHTHTHTQLLEMGKRRQELEKDKRRVRGKENMCVLGLIIRVQG